MLVKSSRTKIANDHVNEMNVSKYSAGHAYRIAVGNKEARWRHLSNSRLNSRPVFQPNLGIFLPAVVPSFSLSKDSKIFTIGSCFARNIQVALVRNGLEVISDLDAMDDKSLFKMTTEHGRENPGGFLYRYNPAAIYYEISRILEDFSPVDNELIFNVGDGWVDYHYNASFALPTQRLAFERRNLLRERFKRITECKLVVMTLGLTEAWFDKETGLYLNSAPDFRFSESTGRFEFVTLSFPTCFDFIKRSVDLIHKHAPAANVVITTSPVPLELTFRPLNVVVANCHSKSTLRAVAGEIEQMFPKRVDYFPSYEIAINSNFDLVWNPNDFRHVNDAFVNEITNYFITRYVRADSADVAEGHQLRQD